MTTLLTLLASADVRALLRPLFNISSICHLLVVSRKVRRYIQAGTRTLTVSNLHDELKLPWFNPSVLRTVILRNVPLKVGWHAAFTRIQSLSLLDCRDYQAGHNLTRLTSLTALALHDINFRNYP